MLKFFRKFAELSIFGNPLELWFSKMFWIDYKPRSGEYISGNESEVVTLLSEEAGSFNITAEDIETSISDVPMGYSSKTFAAFKFSELKVLPAGPWRRLFSVCSKGIQ